MDFASLVARLLLFILRALSSSLTLSRAVDRGQPTGKNERFDSSCGGVVLQANRFRESSKAPRDK